MFERGFLSVTALATKIEMSQDEQLYRWSIGTNGRQVSPE